MQALAILWSLLLVILAVLGDVAHAAQLGIPAPHRIVSGIGVISGWKCAAGELTIRFNGGAPIPLLYGAQRPDVLAAGACAHDRVGFLTIMNWGELGGGEHTAVVYDDGVAFARSRFQVVTTGEAFLAHRSGECLAEDFPMPGDESLFVWNPTTQHMELAEVREWYDEPDVSHLPASADLDFLLDRGSWTIEVPDIESWQTVSQWENPEYHDFIASGRSGNISRYVAGPATVGFLRYVHGATSNKVYAFSQIPPWGIGLAGTIQGTKVAGVDRLGRARLHSALPVHVEVGTLANGLLMQTREAIREMGEGYSFVVPLSTPDTTQSNRCYILVFDDFHRTADGGMETEARFYATARTPYVRGEPRYCVPPVYPGGINGQGYTHVKKPQGVTRILIY